MNNSFFKKELIPNVVVYKKALKNTEEILSFVKKSETISNLNYINNWEEYGNYDSNSPSGMRCSIFLHPIGNDSVTNQDQKTEKEIISQIANARDLTLIDYISQYKDRDFWPVEIKIENYNEHQGFTLLKNNSHSVGLEIDNPYRFDFHLDGVEDNYDFGRQQVITTMIYLNDDYEEGEIEFFIPGNKIVSYKPSAGDILIFPSFYPYYHTPKVPINGNRYALRTSYDINFESSLLKDNNIRFVDIVGPMERENLLNKKNIISLNGDNND